MSGRLRAYLGMSLDGRIAGPADELDWLHDTGSRGVSAPVPDTVGDWLSYEDFMADIGLLLMGRRTYDVVSAFDDWPYGDLPVIVATHRPLPDPVPPTVGATSGTTAEIAVQALGLAQGRDVYVDGGVLVSAILDAGLLEELTTTILPIVLGPGIGLFDALTGPRDLDVCAVATSADGAVQLTWVPRSATPHPG
jgi:dihydrofolate reductase